MSGYRLRALLEDQEFCNSLVNGGNAQLGLGLNGNKDDSGERETFLFYDFYQIDVWESYVFFSIVLLGSSTLPANCYTAFGCVIDLSWVIITHQMFEAIPTTMLVYFHVFNLEDS